MKDDVFVKEGVTIPSHELDITTSRAGGPGGQHVNKSDTRVTLRWNVQKTHVLNDEQKALVLNKLRTRLSVDGDLIVNNSASRSQQQNLHNALENLADTLRKALHVPKKRMKTRVPKAAKIARVDAKTHRGKIKKMRGKKIEFD